MESTNQLELPETATFILILFILVEQALQGLPPAQRVPLVLHHFEGLQYDEVAEKLGFRRETRGPYPGVVEVTLDL